MQGVKKQIVISKSSEETEKLAGQLAGRLKGGEVIELRSDLGGGKTTFTRGLVAGLGSDEVVSSPTFTISREYRQGRLPVVHFDFYRLAEAGIIAAELQEVVEDPESVAVIEWAGIVEQVLPPDRLSISMEIFGEQERKLEFSYPSSLRYLIEEK